jgi:hypothetical protein
MDDQFGTHRQSSPYERHPSLVHVVACRPRGIRRSVPDCLVHFTAPIIYWATADATTCPPRPAIMAASSPGRRLLGYDRLVGLILEYAQVATCG